MTWGTETGLLDEYEGTVDRAYFATDLKYQDGDIPLLHLEITNISADQEAPDTIVEKFSVGNGWQVVDNGAAVERIDGNEKRMFNERSRYGILVKNVVTNKDGAFDGLLDLLQERGDPKQADVWVGLRFRFERVTVNYGPKIGDISFVTPAEFLGVEGQPSSNGNGNGHATVDVEQVKSTLTALAQSADSYDAYAAQAMRVDGVMSDDALLNLVTDPSFYEAAQA